MSTTIEAHTDRMVYTNTHIVANTHYVAPSPKTDGSRSTPSPRP